ncbi:hypothetical protein BC628DRAFT_1391550 [Trametes gibbosa]|nr:hypothetical protein BC628DRAFT_1391550 [Trametes gibbosa]
MTGDNTWHTTYDCSIQEEVMLRVLPEVLPADNPQQSTLCSHVGLHGNHPCRHCGFGGPELERKSDEGYESHFSPGVPRTTADTLAAVHAQIRAAGLGVAKTVADMQTMSGVKDTLAEYWIQQLIVLAREKQQVRIRNTTTRDLRLNARRVLNRAAIVREIEMEIQDELMRWLVTQPDVDFQALTPNSPLRLELRPGVHFNSLLCVESLDVHRDTPVELLHTYLLGVEKYSWYHIHNSWTDSQRDTFATRLQALSLDGLSLPALRASWMLQHPNNLIGKHLKALQQLTMFHLDDSLCDVLTFDLIKATGELGALLWFPKIDDIKEYQEDLTILIGNLLDIWSRIDPQRIFVKLKLHILLHVLEDVRTHGPGILNSTEVFEAFNAVFRGSSVLSNHLAPSRDIANSSAVMESYKHIVSGGWWTDRDGSHVRAGFRVRQSFTDPHVNGQMGIESARDKPGDIHCLQKTRKQAALTWGSLHIEVVNPHGISPVLDSTWYPCQYMVSQHLDRCRVGSWVFADLAGQTVAGRIIQLLISATPEPDVDALVVMKLYTIPSSRHPHFSMPELRRDADDKMHTVVTPKSILFIVNVQHNCRDSVCTASGRQVVRQERQDSNITRPAIQHTNDTLYLINTHALHHAALLRQALSRELTKPLPYIIDRPAEHKIVAATLRSTHQARRQKDADARRTRKEKATADKANLTPNLVVPTGTGEVFAPTHGGGRAGASRSPPPATASTTDRPHATSSSSTGRSVESEDLPGQKSTSSVQMRARANAGGVSEFLPDSAGAMAGTSPSWAQTQEWTASTSHALAGYLPEPSGGHPEPMPAGAQAGSNWMTLASGQRRETWSAYEGKRVLEGLQMVSSRQVHGRRATEAENACTIPQQEGRLHYEESITRSGQLGNEALSMREYHGSFPGGQLFCPPRG